MRKKLAGTSSSRGCKRRGKSVSSQDASPRDSAEQRRRDKSSGRGSSSQGCLDRSSSFLQARTSLLCASVGQFAGSPVVPHAHKKNCFTMGKRHKSVSLLTPGPTDYAPRQLKTNAPGTISKRQYADIWVPKDQILSPGPATYDVKTGYQPKKVSIFLPARERWNANPGVGQYNADFAKKHSHAARISSARKIPFYEKADVPGPQRYHVNNHLSFPMPCSANSYRQTLAKIVSQSKLKLKAKK